MTFLPIFTADPASLFWAKAYVTDEEEQRTESAIDRAAMDAFLLVMKKHVVKERADAWQGWTHEIKVVAMPPHEYEAALMNAYCRGRYAGARKSFLGKETP